MNAHAILTSHGWRGTGHTLHANNDQIGIAKPLLVKHKKDNSGLGTSNFITDQWWLSAIDEQLKGLDTTSGKPVQTVKTGMLGRLDRRVQRYALYDSFVRGETLESTLNKNKEKAESAPTTTQNPTTKTKTKSDKRKSRSSSSSISKSKSSSVSSSSLSPSSDSASESISPAPSGKESKEECRARKQAKRLRKAEKAARKEAKLKRKREKVAKRQAKEEKRTKKRQLANDKAERRALKLAKRAAT
ncbi:hypothetical protein BROUX41_005077 [Berkeleyomyces rouxiae]|uniref:uncharacterized protein n=1 Tax=Berkeleyomyces rouxiae TaxID=2035830 RepID=UPI003B80AA2B